MNTIRRIKNIVLALVNPSILLRNYRTRKEIDEWFRAVLVDPKFEIPEYVSIESVINRENHTIRLNDSLIWVSNRYYASPTADNILELPFVDTTLLFFKKYDEYVDSLRLDAIRKMSKVDK